LASRVCDPAGDWLAVPFGLLVLLVDAEELLAAGVVIVFRLLPGAKTKTLELIATTPECRQKKIFLFAKRTK
jgi:hypothetical protein